MPDPISVAQHGSIQCHLLPALANRHGLNAGTGEFLNSRSLRVTMS